MTSLDGRQALAAEASSPRIARRGVESSQRLSRHRWKVERTLAWLLGYRRLTVRTSAGLTSSKGCFTWPALCSACAV